MPGTVNNIIYADNCDFSGVDLPLEANGLATNGQLWIGRTLVNAGGTHISVGQLVSTDGSISFGYSAPNITAVIAGSGGFVWSDVSGAFSPLRSNGYFINGTATGTLPASPSQGDTIKFIVDHATQLLTIDAPGTQIIRLGNSVSSAGGTLVSTLRGDSITLTYRASDTCWLAQSSVGNWTIT